MYCFAAALAEEKGSWLVTGDPEFKRVADRVKIIWLKFGLTAARRKSTKLQEILGLSGGKPEHLPGTVGASQLRGDGEDLPGKRPVTWIEATQRGCQAFGEYVQVLCCCLNEVETIRLQEGDLVTSSFFLPLPAEI